MALHCASPRWTRRDASGTSGRTATRWEWKHMRSPHARTSAGRALVAVAAAGILLAACSGTEEASAPDPAPVAEVPAESAPDEAPFPNRPIQLVVPFAVGGGADAMARNISSVAGDYIDVPIRVVSQPGASGTVAGNYVLGAEADGHTLVVATYGGLLSAPLLDDVGYSLEDWVTVGMMSFPPFLIASNPSLPFDTLDGLVEYSKANPGAIAYSSTGAGGSAHFMALLMEEAFGVKWTHVPYDGGATALLAVMNGEVQIGFGTASNVLDPAAEGLVNALAVTGPQRVVSAPDLPTIQELGYDFEFAIWQGVAAPADIPAEALAALEEMLRNVASNEAFIRLATRQDGVAPRFMGSAEAAEYLAGEAAFATPIAASIVASR